MLGKFNQFCRLLGGALQHFTLGLSVSVLYSYNTIKTLQSRETLKKIILVILRLMLFLMSEYRGKEVDTVTGFVSRPSTDIKLLLVPR